jgi:hypothetical protein
MSDKSVWRSLIRPSPETQNQSLASTADSGQPILDPAPHRVFVDVKALGRLFHAVATMQLDPLAGQPGHLSRPLTDQRADILNSPHRDSGTKLDRFRKAAGLNTVPPRRLTDRDRAGGSEKTGEADKAGFGKRIRVVHGTNHPFVDVFVSCRIERSSKGVPEIVIEWSEIQPGEFSDFERTKRS